MTKMQREYWDGLSSEYHRITRITLDDFHYGPQIPGESALHLLPRLKKGMKALELGCGGAQNSIWLAGRGAECIAADISKEQLCHARKLAKAAGVSIGFVRAPLDGFRGKIKGRFDLIHSSHAMEFADDPAAVVHDMSRSLKKGGTLMISTVHPLYNGEWIDGVYEEDEALEDVEARGLFLTSYFSPPDDKRFDKDGNLEVISRAYPVSSWFKWFRNAGLEVISIEEPPALPSRMVPPYTSDDWAEPDGELDAIPGTVIFVARKK